MIVTGTYCSTCPHCRAIIDYGCLCEEPQPRDDWRGFNTVDEAKADVGLMKATTPAADTQVGTSNASEPKNIPANGDSQ